MRVAIYARYSTDLQRDASIEDQVRVCTALAKREGETFTEVFSDFAISGSTNQRPGLQALLSAVRAGRIDIVVTEALDRLSRDQEHVAGLYKQLTFADVKIITVAEGEINELHVGLKGVMNALFLKDLAQKTHRGLEGRVEMGRSAGGICYGYDVVRHLNADGTFSTGERAINPAQANILIQVFTEIAAGRSPRTLSYDLNKEGVPPPRGKSEGTAWSPSTIYGNWQRGTGLLNNELYIGQLVWNRQRFIKDPATGKRQARLNPTEEWIRTEVPHLRIIPQDLWDAVKERQGVHRQHRPEKARRPVHLLSGLLVCGACGGGFSMISANHYGCSRARNSGTCNNLLNIRRDKLESMVLDGLRQHLMQPAAVKAFVEEFTKEVNRLAADHDNRRVRLVTEFTKIERKQRSLMDAIMEGTPARLVNADLTALEARRSEIEAQLQAVPLPLPRLHPNLPELYRRKVEDLQEALREPETTTQAALALRGLIDRIRLVPVNGALKIELEGARAALLALGVPESKHPRSGEGSGVQETLVAGAGFEPATFRL